ncbi:MAG TPA: L-threonylcarbamoyladenylate synthase [Longimicrobiales bacterium]
MLRLPFGGEADYARAAPRVARHLERGGVIAYPTETVYGFGGALEDVALERVARLKGREMVKPFLLLVLDGSQAPGLEWTADARRLADAFWPGPLTLALRATVPYPPRVVGPGGTVAVRATPHAGVRAILRAFGGPITSTSVNLPGERPASDVERVVRVAEEAGAGEELWVLDGGRLPDSPPSTIVDCSRTPPRVLRRGAISMNALRGVVDGIHE